MEIWRVALNVQVPPLLTRNESKEALLRFNYRSVL
jgi:hypothetical protein